MWGYATAYVLKGIPASPGQFPVFRCGSGTGRGLCRDEAVTASRERAISTVRPSKQHKYGQFIDTPYLVGDRGSEECASMDLNRPKANERAERCDPSVTCRIRSRITAIDRCFGGIACGVLAVTFLTGVQDEAEANALPPVDQ